FRGTPRMFAQDDRARRMVQEGIRKGEDRACHALEAGFFYLPLEHSESLADQELAVSLYEELDPSAPEALRTTTGQLLRYSPLLSAPRLRPPPPGHHPAVRALPPPQPGARPLVDPGGGGLPPAAGLVVLIPPGQRRVSDDWTSVSSSRY